MAYRISRAEARRYLLRHQRLYAAHSGMVMQDMYAYIRHVNCIQYDPLNIAGHNHELVLQARFPGFRPQMAFQLLYEDRVLLDEWDKNMSILCSEDWPYFRRRRTKARGRFSNHPEIKPVVDEVREQLALRGPLSSLELNFKNKVDWAWAPARLSRAALESMYFWGELAVHHRVHTRRYYDFAANLFPPALLEADDPNITEEQYHDWYVLRRIGGIGLLWNRSGDGWLGIADMKSKDRSAAIARLLAVDKLREVIVEDVKLPLYIRSSDAEELEEVLRTPGPPNPSDFAAAIAPLDNLIWDRELIRQLFGFHYRWEVYKPAAEREYGYYILPLLYGDRFIARFEPVLNKKQNTLSIHRWWWETEVPGAVSITEAGLQYAARLALTKLGQCLGAAAVQFLPAAAAESGLEDFPL